MQTASIEQKILQLLKPDLSWLPLRLPLVGVEVQLLCGLEASRLCTRVCNSRTW